MTVERVQAPYSLRQGLQLRTRARDEIEQVQLHLLREHLEKSRDVPFYKEMFARCGLVSSDIKSLSDVGKLPLTSREDLDRFPTKFGCVAPEMVRDIALTSGTTGSPVIIPYTERDLQRLAYNEAIAFHSAGLRRGDRALLTVTLDRCFIAGLAYYSGLTRLGATALRSGPGQPARQWQIIEQLKPDCLVGVPSFLVALGEWGRERNLVSCVRTVVTIGEPARKSDFSPTAQGKRLQELWEAEIFSSYGATEFETAFGECCAGQGGHVHPELMVVEVVGEDGDPVPDGEPGEVVVTPLGVEGFPLIRFRTGDMARLHRTPCSCGWNTPRLGPVEGRLAQRLKYRGTTFYPETVFMGVQDLLGDVVCCVEVYEAADGADDVCVVVGCDDEKITVESVEVHLQALLRVRPRVALRRREEVERMMSADGGRKPKKFFDFRP